MDDIATITSNLPNYPKKELRVLRSQIDKILSKNDPPGPLFEVLLRAGGNGGIPFSTFRQSGCYKAWKRDESLVMDFITKYWPRRKQVEINALKHFLFSLLGRDLKERGVKVTVTMLAFNVGDIPALFERGFPGYLEAGLANVILKRLVNRHAAD